MIARSSGVNHATPKNHLLSDPSSIIAVQAGHARKRVRKGLVHLRKIIEAHNIIFVQQPALSHRMPTQRSLAKHLPTLFMLRRFTRRLSTPLRSAPRPTNTNRRAPTIPTHTSVINVLTGTHPPLHLRAVLRVPLTLIRQPPLTILTRHLPHNPQRALPPGLHQTTPMHPI